MAAKGVVVYAKKSISNHPFLIGMGCFVFLFYRFFPSTFSWLVSVSPVIVCTILLLGTILCYGEPNFPEIENEDENKIHDTPSLGADSVSSDLGTKKKDESLATGDNVDSGMEIMVASVGEAASDTLNSLAWGWKREMKSGKELNKEREVSKRKFVVKRGMSVRTLGRVLSKVDSYDGEIPTKDHEETEALKLEIDKNESKYSSNSESESESISESESSSPGASMADVMPLVDELHPLLHSEPPQSTHKSTNSYAASRASSQNQGSDDEGDGENQEEEEEEDEEEREKDDGSDGVVKWTADDQQNLMDLGTSELERNQRLENLIAKRRARKIQSAEAEKNLIDFDSNDPVPIVEELSRLLVNTPPISTSRRNPFNLPHEPDIPCSAPSILLPQRNPFDLHYKQEVDNTGHIEESLRPPELLQSQQKELLFRRHESFSVGSSCFGDGSSTRCPRFKLCFVAEETNTEEPGFGSIERQLSEKSGSNASSSPKSESSSSARDRKNSEEHVEQDLHQEGAFGSPAYYNAERAEQESQSSKEVNSVDAEQEHSALNAGGDYAVDLNTSDVLEQAHQINDMPEGEEAGEVIRSEFESKSEMVEGKHEESGSSTSSESIEKSPDTKLREELADNLERMTDAMEGSNDSLQSFMVNSDLQSGTMERVDDGQAAEPVYDSSPSEVDKFPSNVAALDEALFYGGKGSFNSNTSSASDMQVDTSEVGITPGPVDKSLLSGDEGSISSNGSAKKGLASGSAGLWVAASNLSSVEENESRSRGITEIRELDVIQVGFEGFHEDFSTPMACLPTPVARFRHYPSFASVRTQSSEYSSMEEDVSIPSDGDEDEMANDSTLCHRDMFLVYNDLASSASSKTRSSTKELTGWPSSTDVGIEETHISNLDLPPIPEDKLEEFKLGEEHQGMIRHMAKASLTGSQIIEECDVGMEQEDSFLRMKSAGKSEGGDNKVSLLNNKSEIGFNGSLLQKPTESMEFSSPSEMKPELEIKHERDLNNSEEKSHEFHAQGEVTRGIHEVLLSEAKASGDSSKEVKSDQREAKEEAQFDCPIESSPELMKSQDGSVKVETSERHLEPEVLEVESAVEMQFTYKETGTRSITAEKLDGMEAVAGSSSSGASTSQKGKKKKKSSKSSSSSSSRSSLSSSSTDSD